MRVLNCMENHASVTGWQKLFISYKIMLPTFRGRCNRYFWDKRLKMPMLPNFNNYALSACANKIFQKWTVFVFSKSWSRDQVIQRAYYSKIRLHSASPNEVRLFWYNFLNHFYGCEKPSRNRLDIWSLQGQCRHIMPQFNDLLCKLARC